VLYKQHCSRTVFGMLLWLADTACSIAVRVERRCLGFADPACSIAVRVERRCLGFADPACRIAETVLGEGA
jgi:hypothetical protein